MCSPTQGAMAGLQLGSSYMAQQGAADLQERQNRAATRAANQALEQDLEILDRRIEEERQAKGQSDFDLKVAAMELQAKANVSAGEAGVSGKTEDRVRQDIERQKGKFAVRKTKSYVNRLNTIGDQADKATARMVSRINNLPPVVKPNFIATAVQIGSSYITPKVAGDIDSYFASLFDSGGDTNG